MWMPVRCSGWPDGDGTSPDVCMVLISDRSARYGLQVDRFVGKQELAPIPLDLRLGRIPNVRDGAILADGSAALILDVDDVLRSIGHLLVHGRCD